MQSTLNHESASAPSWVASPLSFPPETWFQKRQETPWTPSRVSGGAVRGLDGTLPPERCREAKVEPAVRPSDIGREEAKRT